MKQAKIGNSLTSMITNLKSTKNLKMGKSTAYQIKKIFKKPVTSKEPSRKGKKTCCMT